MSNQTNCEASKIVIDGKHIPECNNKPAFVNVYGAYLCLHCGTYWLDRFRREMGRATVTDESGNTSQIAVNTFVIRK